MTSSGENMALVRKQNNTYFEPLQVVYDVINQNVLDPNKERSLSVKQSERRWVFPTMPEANDENYPRIAVIHGKPVISESQAGQLLETQFVPNMVKDIYSNIVVIPVTIGVFTKKTSHKALEVNDYDGTKRFVENSAQVAYLLDRVQKALHSHRRDFIDKDMDIKIIDFEGAYQDNDFLWAGNINMEIVINNMWVDDITKIIDFINLNITVTLTS